MSREAEWLECLTRLVKLASTQFSGVWLGFSRGVQDLEGFSGITGFVRDGGGRGFARL